jgi:hypothetical protein
MSDRERIAERQRIKKVDREAALIPPGYHEGGYVHLSDGQVRVGDFAIEAGGFRAVITEPVFAAEMEWRAPFEASKNYYIYADQYGKTYVDNQTPEEETAIGKVHPSRAERFLGYFKTNANKAMLNPVSARDYISGNQLILGDLTVGTTPTVFVDISTNRVGIGTVNPDQGLHLHATGSGINYALFTNDTTTQDGSSGFLIGIDIVEQAVLWNYEATALVFGTNNGEKARIDSAGDFGIGISASLAAKLHVDQSATDGAKPVLYLDQADVSEEMIEFNTTIGVGNAIEAVGGKTLTITHFIKTTITGVGTRYIPAGTIA